MITTNKPKRGVTKYNHPHLGEVWYYITNPQGLILVSQDKKFADLHTCKPDELTEASKGFNKPINKVSEAKKEDDKIYATSRKVYLGNHAVCEVKLTGCQQKANQIHHRKGRIGKNYIDIHTFLACCDNCHRWIENNVTQAKELGFSIDRL